MPQTLSRVAANQQCQHQDLHQQHLRYDSLEVFIYKQIFTFKSENVILCTAVQNKSNPCQDIRELNAPN